MHAQADLLQAIVTFAGKVVAPTLEQFCGLLEKLPHHPPTDQRLVALANQLSQPEVRGLLGDLLEVWRLKGGRHHSAGAGVVVEGGQPDG